MKAIVTGGREYGETRGHLTLAESVAIRARAQRERDALFAVLDELHGLGRHFEIAQGGCKTGADRWAREWALKRGVSCETYPADWERCGRSAGPRRNQFMVEDFCPDVGVAAPGGRGTDDCKRRLFARGCRIIEVPVEGSEEK